jgi:hypothetical protein
VSGERRHRTSIRFGPGNLEGVARA